MGTLAHWNYINPPLSLFDLLEKKIEKFHRKKMKSSGSIMFNSINSLEIDERKGYKSTTHLWFMMLSSSSFFFFQIFAEKHKQPKC
jgi:hypothetical protein